MNKNTRLDFPIFKQTINGHPLVYLDSAATTQKPQAVIDAVSNFYAHANAPVHRGVYTLAEQATAGYEQVRTQVARYIGARHASEIIFTSGCTESINLVAASWAQHNLQAGDEILVTGMEHHANLLPWQRIAHERGVRLVIIPVTPQGTLDLAQLPALVTASTKLVALNHVSNVLGTHNDIAPIIQHARRVGAKVLVDAAQSVAHQRIDVVAMDCDFLTFSGHKMLGPTGVGVLYAKKELHNQMQPYQVGGSMVYEVSSHDAVWQQAPHKFEAGTPPIAQVIGLGAALDYLSATDFAALQQHEAALCAQLIDGLQAIPQVRILGPIKELQQKGHLVSFVIDGFHAHDVAAYLDSYGICVRAGHHCAQPLAKVLDVVSSVRVSFYGFYNTSAEVALLVEKLQQLCA